MVFIYIQTIAVRSNTEALYRITIKSPDCDDKIFFNIRPQVSVPHKIYKSHNLDRLEIILAPPFCDVADELIALFTTKQLVFLEAKQFRLLKSQFKTIGYNFNVRPKLIFNIVAIRNQKKMNSLDLNAGNNSESSLEFAFATIDFMQNYFEEETNGNSAQQLSAYNSLSQSLSKHKKRPGVYFFLDEFDEIVYVGKTKNIRKRLQSHFSGHSRQTNIDYSKVKRISVEYTGNDIIGQLVESENIKNLKPTYNSQQITDPAPYIINKRKTAKGIFKLKITRKEYKDNLPEKFFNRASVKQSLESFCSEYKMCRKQCGLESAKGPCTNFTEKGHICVCAGEESINSYNDRFEIALNQFLEKKSRKIYKLKGRTKSEDAFIYMVNDIYEGYGFIEKEESITNENDVLGHLIPKSNNYDTSRIVSGLSKKVSPQNILTLSE